MTRVLSFGTVALALLPLPLLAAAGKGASDLLPPGRR